MSLKRILTHLLYGRRRMRQAFPEATLSHIQQEIEAAERSHSGEIRFAVEAALEGKPLWAGQSARERAIDVFSQLRVWDTEHNNGVLIYLLMADRDVEIVADRGINTHVSQDAWAQICRDMEAHLSRGDFDRAFCSGIQAVASHLQSHYPATGASNELPDSPVLL